MINKYYLKEECKGYWETLSTFISCNKNPLCDCKGIGFFRGADITELIEVIENDKRISGQEFGYILDITKDLIEVVEEE